MTGHAPQRAEIIVPTGRGGFCCILPCALIAALYALIACAIVLAVRMLRDRRRAAPR